MKEAKIKALKDQCTSEVAWFLEGLKKNVILDCFKDVSH
jgi:hypothetical protein